MHWDDLRFFLAVARARQLNRAALVLQVDATTVARRIKRLELSLAETLFEQTKDGHVLSEAGETLLVKAEAVERSMSEIGASGADRRSVSGGIRISVSEGFGTWLVARELHSFLTKFPEVRIDLVASSGFLSPSRRETDIAILLARPRSGPLMTKKLADYSLGVYASRNYLRWHKEPVVETADLRQHCLVGYVPDLVYAPELRYLEDVLPGVVPAVRSTSINAQHRLIASGSGVGILPCFMGNADPTLVRVLPEISVGRTFWLVTHQDTRRLRRIEAFVSWIQEVTIKLHSELVGQPSSHTTDLR